MDLQTYAVMKKELKKMTGEEVGKVVKDYVEKNPSAILESIGLKQVDGCLCMDDGLNGEKAVSDSDTEK